MSKKKALCFYLSMIFIVMVCSNRSLFPEEEPVDSGNSYAVKLSAGEKVTIDGALNESIWTKPPIDTKFITLMPVFGKALDQKTEVWAAYDTENLYFAFRCFDSKPDRIQTSVAQRDKLGNDDKVGVLLDSLGSTQSGYEFYTNPSGIQMDALNSSVSQSDITPDFVWESAGKLTGQGYLVEIRIPLTSIRFNVNKQNETRMRVMFFRQITHMGTVATWPQIKPGQTDLNCMTGLVYKGLKSGGHKIEILPNFTYSSDSQRVAKNSWEKSSDTNVGVGIKYGITSSITVEATVNPDFSQVESDVFQAEANRRFALFYSEKRPFFMESQDVLDFSVIHDTMASLLEQGMMIKPIHTRRIEDPGWALKLSGSAGKVNFAVLAANDRSPGASQDYGANPFEGKNALFGIFRAKYNFSADNTLGVLYTGRHFSAAGERNNVGGLDLKYRFSGNLRASLSYLRSETVDAEGLPARQGDGVNAVLQFINPKWIITGSYERYGNDFYMATAFQNRVGISRFWFGVGPYLNVKSKRLPWLKRLVPYFHYAHLHDLGTGMNDISRVYGLYMNFAPLGELYLEYRAENEAWKGVLFDKNYFIVLGYTQITRWLYLSTNVYWGGQIYYPSEVPFSGTDHTVNVGVTIQPSSKFKVAVDYTYSDFKDKLTNQEIYSLNIYNLNATYQFNKYFFVRGTLRYDDLQEKLLTDFLASFTLIPGTVVHLGYGSLYLKNQWNGQMWIPGQGSLTEMRRGLFFKASYLWRIK